MGAHANLVLLWGANLASQPNTAPHLLAAKRRGAHVVTIDVRRTEAASHSHDLLLLRPGTDAALALALMHVIIGERLHDVAFVAAHTVGFDALAEHVKAYSPQWASAITGVSVDSIVALARRYATTPPAMIVLGGSSMNKSATGWQSGRAISCLPALCGYYGSKGGGLGPRHASRSHGQGFADITAPERRPPGRYVPSQMPRIIEALARRELRVLLLFGTDMLSSYADTSSVVRGLERADLVVAHDLFMNDTARRCADVVLPGTCWLEELGCKATNTHLYLMEPALTPPDGVRSITSTLRSLAEMLGLADFYPWATAEGPFDARLDHPSTGHATIAALRAEGGIRALAVSHVGHPDLSFPTPSGKIELESRRAPALGLPPLPVYEPRAEEVTAYPLAFRQGRTLNAFHSFYDHGRALPTLAKKSREPVVWISEQDAAARAITDGQRVKVHNGRGAMGARAYVTDKIAPGTVWMRSGWSGLNSLTAGDAVLPDGGIDPFMEAFDFSGGQASFGAMVEVSPTLGPADDEAPGG